MKGVPKSLKQLHRELPKFPDGRIDYTNATKSAVLTCFLEYKGKVLLLKRSNKVGSYKGIWNAVAGYLDELKPLSEKVLEEVKEELGILEENIGKIKVGKIYEFTDNKISKTWIVHPVLIKLKKEPTIILDWEHTEYVWIHPKDIKSYQITPKLDESLKRVLFEN